MSRVAPRPLKETHIDTKCGEENSVPYDSQGVATSYVGAEGRTDGRTGGRGACERWNAVRPSAEENPAVCDNTGGPRGHYAKRHESGRERKMGRARLYVKSKKQQKNVTCRYREQIAGRQRCGWGGGGRKVRASSFKINKSWDAIVFSKLKKKIERKEPS